MSIRRFATLSSLLMALAALAPATAGQPAADQATSAAEPPAPLIAAEGAAVEIIEEQETQAVEPTYGQPIATRMRVGARVEAKGGEVRDVFIMVAVPLECPEQEVHVVEEDISPNVGTVEFRTLPDVKLAEPGARQMLISVPLLPARQTANAAITYEIVTKQVYAPEETDALVIPAKPPKQLKPFLSGSPYINVGDRKIKDAIKEALEQRALKDLAAGSTNAGGAPEASPGGGGSPDEADAYETVDSTSQSDDASSPSSDAPKAAESDSEESPVVDPKQVATAIEKLTDWQRVEALYDFVREKVKYLDGAEDMSSIQALKEKEADCHGLSALFVAMCRTMKVPARMVWVDGHQYAEFYLEDENGKGFWYPAQLAGTRAFGSMPTPMVIFQKGDNFRVPERRRERLRYATDHTTLSSSPQHKPRVVYIREQL